MSQILVACCDSKYHDYTVTYKKPNGEEQVHPICNVCWTRQFPIRLDETTIKSVKIFQIEVSKIICNKCKTDVTKTMGCSTCHPEEFSNQKVIVN